ncbi:MAG: 3-oxoacyl-ACP reductase FabG [Rhizobiaceae bacterium]
MLTSIAGRSVIVTGASKGIGKGIAKVFAAQGAKILVVSRTLSEAEACAKEIGNGASGFSADISNWEQSQAMAQAAVDRNGGLDILCANAGIYPQTNIEDMDPDEWDLVMSTNLKGTFLSVKACLPHLKNSDQGRVILTSSITGPETGFPGWSHYGASKSGQLGFMRTACIELAKDAITMNAVLPGNIFTEGLEGLGDDYIATMAASIPLKKIGSVEDIGNAALFLASKEANYITGQTIIVDGGQILPESLEALA